MVTADEIRARVEAADRALIQARADTATAVAADMEHRATLLAQLDEIQASLTARLDAAAAIMTLTELAEFTGIPETELRAAGHPTGAPRQRTPTRGRTTRPAGRARRRTATAPVPSAEDTNTADAEQSS